MLDFLSDVLKDFCDKQELPFMSADDILYGNKKFLIEGQLVTLSDSLSSTQIKSQLILKSFIR